MQLTAVKQTPPSADSDTHPYVVAKNLCKYYPISGLGHRVVKSVDDVSLTIGEGEVLGLVGESGIGFLLGLGAAHIGAQLFTAKSGVILPVGFTREDLRLALFLLGFAAVLAAIPALLAYRQSPAAALRA